MRERLKDKRQRWKAEQGHRQNRTDKYPTSPIGEGRTTRELTYVFLDSWPEGEWT